MKILTLNAHGLLEEKWKVFVDAIILEKPDIIALQTIWNMETLIEMLKKRGMEYCFEYEKGVGLMSLSPILETSTKRVGENGSIIGICTEKEPDQWLFNVCYDERESFFTQWQKTKEYVEPLKCSWLLGEFYNPVNIRDEGYDEMCYDGWKDCYLFAGEGKIAGKAWFKSKKIINDYRVIFDGTNYSDVCDYMGIIVEADNM